MKKLLLALLIFSSPAYADGLIVPPSAVGVAQIGQIPGVADNSTPCIGCVGEIITSSRETGASLPLTTSTASSVTSITLTAGNWMISGNACFDAGSTTTLELLLGMVSTTQNSISGITSVNQARLTYNNASASGTICLVTPRQSVYVSSTTTYYLNNYGIFATSTLKGYGSLIANRIR